MTLGPAGFAGRMIDKPGRIGHNCVGDFGGGFRAVSGYGGFRGPS